MNYAFLPLLAVLTSVAAYVIAVRVWNRKPRALRPALRRALEVIGLASVFLAANFAVGLLIVLLVRGVSGRFISAYVLNDTTLVVMSTLQGMLWSFWEHAEDSWLAYRRRRALLGARAHRGGRRSGDVGLVGPDL